MSTLEDTLCFQIKASKLPAPEAEFRFCERRWRFDFAWPTLKIACEVEGGLWNYGRHQRPKSYEADCIKYNAAQLLGWRVYRVTASMIQSGSALAMLEKALLNIDIVEV